jgi:ribonuclease M5
MRLPAVAVEGPRDVAAVKRAGPWPCLVTHGFTLSLDVRRHLVRAARGRGLVVLTDPDAAGATIRRAIRQAVGPCAHAWLRVDEARGMRNGAVNTGVEHAGPEAIQAALAAARTWRADPPRRFTAGEVKRLGLDDADRRWAVCEALRIGHPPLSALPRRLDALGVAPGELATASLAFDNELHLASIGSNRA